ncbi:hypothetical protein [Planomonospora sp. ID82291]|uniref:hypothetical protein n=1 Tax=Planomonospora sp. ID82291 TaxID=2738136 RepID=UPI0018C3DF06|nr:hypothetical protein [Planomonospora sp. ID82291]MBG0817840.1 MFS transporter [Planomonospora sp. ID82291]
MFVKRYAELLASPGSAGFTGTGLLLRLPFMMNGVSTIMLIAQLRGSYAMAGAVGASALAAGVVTVPWISRLIDRRGQLRVAVPAVLNWVFWSAVLLICCRSGAAEWTLFAAAILSSTYPNVGGLSRARWAELHRDDPASLHVATSLEQVIDEVAFVIGPVLAAALCGLLPEAGRAAGIALALVGLVCLSAQRGTEPRPAPGGKASGSSLTHPGMRVLLVVFFGTGILFGALEITTVAATEAWGVPLASGFVLALQAAGSAVAGLALGAAEQGGETATRFLRGLGGMALCVSLPIAAWNLPSLALLMFLAGTATAPTMISGMSLLQRITPRSQLSENLGIAVVAISTGIAAGSALTGSIIESLGAQTGYLLPPAAAALSLAVAFVGRSRLRPAAASAGGRER